MNRIITSLYLVGILSFSQCVSADDHWQWLPKITQHPNVSVAKGSIQAQQWRIKELQAQTGLDVAISTSGDVPILSQFDSDFSRASDSNPYLDIVVSGTYTLYDFDQAQQNINAEKTNHEVRQLEYLAVVEEELHSLLTLVIDNQKVQEQLGVLKAAFPQLQDIKQQLETRYEAGLGTLTEVRQIQVQMLDLQSQITLLENRMLALQLAAEEQYDLSSEGLVAVWHDVKHILTSERALDVNGRSDQLSELKIKALIHRQASVQAEAMPVLQGELNATLYDVTRSLNNHQLSGQVRLQMPIFDSGHRDARLGGLSHAMTTELDMKRQFQRQKQFQLNEISRQLADMLARQEIAQDKLENQIKQLQSLKQALGNTSNDINSIGVSIGQIAATRADLAGLQSDISLNFLQKLLVTEQLLLSLDMSLEELY